MNVRLALSAGVLLVLAAGCGTPAAPAKVTPPAPQATSPSVSAKPAGPVKMPHLVGVNGAVAQDRLSKLGITNVQFGSADPTAKVVLLVANWTVVKQSEKPGAKVDPGQLVVLTVVKNGD